MARDVLTGSPDVSSDGPTLSPRGVWNSANSYVQRDVVSYLAGSYMATKNVAAGGSSPAVDSARWMQIAAGGGELAYAEWTGGATFASGVISAATTITDVLGCTIVVPAGSPSYALEFQGIAQVNFNASAVAANSCVVRLAVIDDTGKWVAQSIAKQSFIAASNGPLVTLSGRKRMPATAVAKTFKLSYYVDTFTNVTNVSIFTGDGTGTTNLSIPPHFLQATAL